MRAQPVLHFHLCIIIAVHPAVQEAKSRSRLPQASMGLMHTRRATCSRIPSARRGDYILNILFTVIAIARPCEAVNSLGRTSRAGLRHMEEAIQSDSDGDVRPSNLLFSGEGCTLAH